jgi:hypothetical protein
MGRWSRQYNLNLRASARDPKKKGELKMKTIKVGDVVKVPVTVVFPNRTSDSRYYWTHGIAKKVWKDSEGYFVANVDCLSYGYRSVVNKNFLAGQMKKKDYTCLPEVKAFKRMFDVDLPYKKPLY